MPRLQSTLSSMSRNGVMSSGECTFARSIQRLHVEDINTLHLSKNFQSLQTSRLLKIRWDGARCCSGRKQIGLSLDFCTPVYQPHPVLPIDLAQAPPSYIYYAPSNFFNLLPLLAGASPENRVSWVRVDGKGQGAIGTYGARKL